MSLSEHQAEGAALASIELHRTFITALVMSEVMSKEQALGLIDTVLQRVERMQMGAAQHGPAFLVEQAKAARLHIETLAKGLTQLDIPKS